MKYLGTGLSGLVGSRVVELLRSRHDFINFSLETGVDITDKSDIMARIIGDHDASWVLHFAAYTNVQKAEDERQLGEGSAAWKVNVAATEYIVDACRQSGKHLLYIDTDYAFDGTKKEYTENDVPNPLGWYAMTKSLGARRVLEMGQFGLIMRISNPYRAQSGGTSSHGGKTDFVHKMLNRLQAGEEITAASDQLFVPTFVDDIAGATETLTEANAHGVIHVTGSEPVSPFDAARMVAELYSVPLGLVKATTFSSYFKDRAPTPQWAVLKSNLLQTFGISMRGFRDGIAEMKRQEEISE